MTCPVIRVHTHCQKSVCGDVVAVEYDVTIVMLLL